MTGWPADDNWMLGTTAIAEQTVGTGDKSVK